MLPLVSLIVTTKNEANRISACIESIKKQTYAVIEIIVIDNHSSDNTASIARRRGADVYSKGPERSAQRNYGAKKAKGKYLLFLDADMELTPGVVEEAVKAIRQLKNKNQELMALVIPEKSFGTGFWSQCKALERSFYLDVPWIESARFFQKKVFLEVGGYDEALTGPEDFELPQRLTIRFGERCVGRISSFILHNEGSLTLGKTLKKKYYYGKKMDKYRKKNSAQGYFDRQANIFARYTLFFAKSSIIRPNPVLFLGMLIMKMLEFGAVALGALSQKLGGNV